MGWIRSGCPSPNVREAGLSAWEAERLRLFDALTWQIRCSVVAVADPSSPWLMARRSCPSEGAIACRDRVLRKGTARASNMVAELASLDQLAWIGVNKSGFVGVSRACQFALSAWAIPLVSGPVVTQDPKGPHAAVCQRSE